MLTHVIPRQTGAIDNDTYDPRPLVNAKCYFCIVLTSLHHQLSVTKRLIRLTNQVPPPVLHL
jgi:hypothetical protein